MINFSAATEKHVGAEAGPVQNPAGFHNENITNFKRPNFDLGRHENPLEENHWNLYKDLCLHLQKKSSESISNARKMYSFTRLARSWRSKDLRTTNYKLFERVRTMYYDHKLMSGTKLERAVSPECSENVVSKRNLKNECKKPERQPLKRLQLCRRRLEKVEIIFLRCIWYTTERTIPRISKHFRMRWSY